MNAYERMNEELKDLPVSTFEMHVMTHADMLHVFQWNASRLSEVMKDIKPIAKTAKGIANYATGEPRYVPAYNPVEVSRAYHAGQEQQNDQQK